MTRTLRVSQPCEPALLHTALEAAGLKVTTVRADWAKQGDPVALWAVVVFDVSVDIAAKAAQIQAVISAHLSDAAVKGKRPSPIVGVDQEASLRRHELV